MAPATVGSGYSVPGYTKPGGRRGPTRLKVENAVRIISEWTGVEHLATDLFNLLSGIVGKVSSKSLQNIVKPHGVCGLCTAGEFLV